MATDSSPEQALPAAPESGRSRLPTMLTIGFVLAIALATLAAVFLRGDSAAEAAAAEAIRKTGALVVPDPASGKIVSVNLATVETPEALDEAIAQLPALSHVTALDASRTSIKDDHLKAVGAMPAVTSLVLSETGITDAGVEHLRSLDSIQTLILSSTGITDASMDVIGELSTLRSVDVSVTKVANNLAPLTKLPELAWLLIRELTLGEGSLQQLKGCDKLTRLTIDGSKYPESELDDLKKAIPQMSVN